MTCYVLGCPVSPVLSAVHRRYGPVCACRRHYPGPLSLPLTARAGWVSAPLAHVAPVFRGPGADLWEGPRVALAPILAAPPVAPGPEGSGFDTFGDRQPAPPPPPALPPGAPALVAPLAPRSPAFPAERFTAPRRDASTLIAF